MRAGEVFRQEEVKIECGKDKGDEIQKRRR